MKPPGARPGEFHPGDSPQIRAFPLENFQKKVVNLSKNPVNLSIFSEIPYSRTRRLAPPSYRNPPNAHGRQMRANAPSSRCGRSQKIALVRGWSRDYSDKIREDAGSEITPEEIRRGATRLRARNAPIQNRGSSVFQGTRGRLRKGGSSTAPRRVTHSLLSSSHPKFTNPPLALYSLSCRWSFTHNTRRPGNITRGARGDPTCLTRLDP